MKLFFYRLLPAALLFINAAGSLNAQNVYFPGVVPFISLSAGLSDKYDLNVLALSKVRIGDHVIKSVDYLPGPTQFYSHAILSYRLNPHWQVGGGVAFQRNDPFHNWRNDFRLIEQV